MKSVGNLPVLVVHDPSEAGATIRSAIKHIVKELEALGFSVIEAEDHSDGMLAIKAHPDLGAILVGWAEGLGRPSDEREPVELLALAQARFDQLPVFLMTEGLSIEDMTPEIAASLTGSIWLTEDSPEWIAGHIQKAVEHYYDRLLPPFFGELLHYVEEYKYGWHTPGHMGGLAFLKSPAGHLFYDFLGEKALRADLSSSVPALGSILEHQGVVRQAEVAAARAFGADTTYFVTNGTTMSNQIVFRSVVTPGDVVLLDRNCHKSIVNSVIQVGAIPVWLLPLRNRFGMIGPIDPAEMTPEAIKAKLAMNPLVPKDGEHPVRIAVVTNSTYDGTMYDTTEVLSRLGNVTDTVHFDEAWIPYAAFHPLYADHFAMASHPHGDGQLPTVVSTMSNHKMLAALSQASMVHIRQGRAPLPEDRFNEAFMMHTSTSPQYLIFASLDVSTKMMEGAPGRALMNDAIEEAIAFRAELAVVRDRLAAELEWWFDIWQPEQVSLKGTDGAPGYELSFSDASHDVLTSDRSVWEMHPEDSWHGFAGIEPGYAMLDPTKVSIVSPGITESGAPEPWGIPAALVSALLGEKGVVSEKTGFYSLLFLFSIGVTKGKSATLVAELFEFKHLFDTNVPVREAMPSLAAVYPERYGEVGLRDLAHEMHEFLAGYDTSEMQEAIYRRLPRQAMTPGEAFGHLVRGDVEHVRLEDLEGRVSAVLCVLYPPGIPVVVPGERFDHESRSIIEYLRLFENWDARFSGFESEVQGVVKQRDESGNVRFSVNCVIEH
jgi:lysine decarboxylase/arginine decarboxylase